MRWPSTSPTWQSLLDLNKTIKLQSQSFDLDTMQELRHLGRVHKVNLQSVDEQLENNTFNLVYCETSMQVGNGFTKTISNGTEWQTALQQLFIRLAS